MINNIDELKNIIIGRGKPKIYAFTTQTIPNYLKVGETSRPIEKRLDEWRHHFPNLSKKFCDDALVDDDKYYFRDYAVHEFLISEKERTRLEQKDIAPEIYYSNEFFKDATVDDVKEAITDIKQDYMNEGNKYQFYDINGKIKEDKIERTQTFEPRPNQQEVIDKFIEARNNGSRKLLMYAVMRFGKSFTSMCCAVEMEAKFVLIVTAKATVKKEWRDTIKGHVKFIDYEFITAENLEEDYKIITKLLSAGKKVACFLTLQDLQGENIKGKHRGIFKNKIDLLIVDETHFGARAPKYGKIIEESDIDKGDVKADKDYSDYVEDNNTEKAKDIVKKLNVDTTLHLSGTPYNILMGEEFPEQDIIATCQFTDIMKAQEDWNKEHLDYSSDDASCEEWNNPYYGFPQMVRFAFYPNKSAREKLEQIKENGGSYSFASLLMPKSVKKDANGLHKQFVNEREVLDLLKVIDGSKDDDELFGFLDYEGLKKGGMLRHMVMVLPRCASCDAMETLIIAHLAEFKNLKDYKILNISGVDNPDKFKSIESITSKISEYENAGQKTITLTVNRMLTGSTVPQWDTMIYMKDTSSAQEYDQAIFRLQNKFVTESVSADGSVSYNNRKPQTLLVDFSPDRMFAMQEERSFNCCMYKNVTDNETRRIHIDTELTYSPIIAVNKNRMVKVNATDLMNKVSNYQKDRGINEEALDIPQDLSMWDDPELRKIILKENPINSGKGFNTPAHKGEGEGNDYDTPDNSQTPEGGNTGDIGETGEQPTPVQPQNDENNDDFKKRIQSYYARVLLYSYLTKDRVICVQDILNSMDTPDNSRISDHLGLYKDYLEKVYKFLSDRPRILQRLDYKIQHLNNLSHDENMSAEEKANVAVKKFGKLDAAIVITPSKICDEMVNLFPDEFIKGLSECNGKILDIAASAGEFALALHKKMMALGLDKDFIKNAIYTIPKSSVCYELVRKVYDMLGLNVNNIATEFNAFKLLNVKTNNKIDYEKISNILKQNKPFNTISLSDEPEQGDEKVEFNAVIGNPPYQSETENESENNGQNPRTNIFHHFQIQAEDLTELSTVLIYPGIRWLHQSGKGVKSFGKNLINSVKLSKVIFYPQSKDVFDCADISDGITIVYTDKEKNTEGFNYEYRIKDNNYAIHQENPADDLLLINPKDIVIANKIKQFVKKYDLNYLHESILPRSLFGIESDFIEKNSHKARLLSENDILNDNEIKLLTNDKAGPAGRSCWFIIDKSLIKNNMKYINEWQVVVSSAHPGGQAGRDNQIAIIDNHSVFGRSRLALKSFKTEFEAKNFFKFANCSLIKYAFLLTYESLSSLAKYVPDLSDYTDNNELFDFSKSYNDLNAQIYESFNITQEEIAFIESMIKPME